MKRELGEVEDELDRRRPAIEQQHDPAAQHARRDHAFGATEDQPEDERNVAERERVRAAAEVKMDDAPLGQGERDRDQPPGNVRLSDRLDPAGRPDVERQRESQDGHVKCPNWVHAAQSPQRPSGPQGRRWLSCDDGVRLHRACVGRPSPTPPRGYIGGNLQKLKSQSGSFLTIVLLRAVMN